MKYKLMMKIIKKHRNYKIKLFASYRNLKFYPKQSV